MGRLEHRRPIGLWTARLRRDHWIQDLTCSGRGSRERTGQVVSQGKGEAHLRLVRGYRNPVGRDGPRGLVDKPALADAGLPIDDHRCRAPLAARPSHYCVDDVELVLTPEELGHADHTTCRSFPPDPREFPHETCGRRLYV